MKVYVLVYDGFVQFEVILANYFLQTKAEIITVGVNYELITSAEKFQIVPHIKLNDVVIDEVDLFIIPGGDPEKLFQIEEIYKLLVTLNSKGVKIAAICGGPVHLARSGILNGRKYTTSLSVDEYDYFDKNNFVDTSIVQDHNIITAKGNAYVDFALKLGAIMNIYEDDADYQETIRYFREFKDE